MKYVRGFCSMWRMVGQESEHVGLRERLSLCHESGRDRARDWVAYERAVLMAGGKAQPLCRRDSRAWRRMDKYLDRRARSLASEKTWFELAALCGHRRQRLDSFVAMSDRLGPHGTPTIAKARELVEIAERACVMRELAEKRMEIV